MVPHALVPLLIISKKIDIYDPVSVIGNPISNKHPHKEFQRQSLPPQKIQL